MSISAFHPTQRSKNPLPEPEEGSIPELKPSPGPLIRGVDRIHFIALAALLNRNPDDSLVQGLGIKLYTILNIHREAPAKLGLVRFIDTAPSRSNPRNLLPLKVRFRPNDPPHRPEIYLTRSDEIRGSFKKFSFAVGFPSCTPLAILSMPKGTKDDPENWSSESRQECDAAIKFGQHPSVARCHDLFLYSSSKPHRQTRVGMVVERLNYDLQMIFPIKNDNDLLRILRNSARCLQQLHDSGVVHRDIKPDNLGVNARTAEIRLLDLGFLCNAGEPMKVCGSPNYVAPEVLSYALLQTDPPPPSLPNQDVWSLGILIYAFTGPGTSPIFQRTFVKNFEKKVQTDPGILSQLIEKEISERADLSAAMKEVLNGMLQVDPLRRLSMRRVLDLLSQADFCIRPKPLPLPPEDLLG